jgi:hypothetical protein
VTCAYFLSQGGAIIECMFESLDDAGVVDAIADAARAQNAMCGRELAAIGELYARRAPAEDADRFNWAVDGHENVVAEVAAALGISRGRVSRLFLADPDLGSSSRAAYSGSISGFNAGGQRKAAC